jgi:hypothetical protein
MDGGDFYANISGLEHYKHFGYKAMLRSSEEFATDLLTNDWMKVPYRRNRGTLHDGDYPHFSSPIRSIVNGKKRVILGLNFFSESVGECCRRAPEHSDAFNRTVKLYQMMSKLGNESGTTLGGKYSSSPSQRGNEREREGEEKREDEEGKTRSSASMESKPTKKGFTLKKSLTPSPFPPSPHCGVGFSAKDIAKNPAMARMFILAAKKVKEIQIREGTSAQSPPADPPDSL